MVWNGQCQTTPAVSSPWEPEESMPREVRDVANCCSHHLNYDLLRTETGESVGYDDHSESQGMWLNTTRKYIQYRIAAHSIVKQSCLLLCWSHFTKLLISKYLADLGVINCHCSINFYCTHTSESGSHRLFQTRRMLDWTLSTHN